MVATNNPIIVKDNASPAASATEPNRSAEDAAPRTIGRIGKTHGDKIDNTPATKANTRLPIVTGRDRLERLIQQGGDGVAIRITDRSALFFPAFECNQCRLHSGTKAFDQFFLAVKVNNEIGKALEFRISR